VADARRRPAGWHAGRVEADALAGRFGEDDHHFHVGYLTEEQADADAAEVLGLLGLDPGAQVLDAGCGDGRLAVRLAAAGLAVVGVDADEAQIGRARARPASPAWTLEWRVGDLAELDEPAGFDGAFSWFNSLGFGSEAHHGRVLDALCAALAPGGVLVLDVLDPEALAALLAGGVGSAEVRVDGDRQVDGSRFDAATGRLEVERRTWRGGVESVRHLSVLAWGPERWAAELARRGVVLESASARAGAERLDSEGELVLVGRRA
jgi:SAM-dependent methyltransferase